MIQSSELGILKGELSLRDLEMVLPSLIPSGDTALLTDFDETICSSYSYDLGSRTHWPNIDSRVSLEARRMQSPLFIATSRASTEPVVQEAIASLVSHRELPIICENGAVLFFPTKGREIVLATDAQRQQMDEVKGHISQVGSEFRDRELLIKDNRIATIEMRIQHASGIGDPTLYGELAQLLSGRFDLTDLDLVSSNNSLSIQPRGINKGKAFLEALTLLGLKRRSLFVVGLGDAPNDREIFEQSDLGIAVRKGAKDNADIVVDEGDKTTLLVMQNIK
jgi:hydroxymethylpyrimidine pyrophosphatase-like HAD family hydrolase